MTAMGEPHSIEEAISALPCGERLLRGASIVPVAATDGSDWVLNVSVSRFVVGRRVKVIAPNLAGTPDAFMRSSNHDKHSSVSFNSGMNSSQSIGVTQERLAAISLVDS